MFKYRFFFTVLMSLVLMSCGGGNKEKTSLEPVPTNGNKTTKINTFLVNGTSAKVKGAVPINTNMKSGTFTVSWYVDSSDTFEVDIYVSNDPFLSDKTDVHIFGQRCGNTKVYRCDDKGSVKCSFNTDNKIGCAYSNTGKDQISISSVLDRLPQTAYIIIEACNITYKSCKVDTQKVEFQ